jgi:transposase
VVAMEACGGAHHIGRFCVERGHEPRLMSPLVNRHACLDAPFDARIF